LTQRPDGRSAPLLAHADAAFWLSGVLLLATCVAAGLTFFWDGVLTGPAVMNGSARGTALTLLLLTAPVMVVAMAFTARGSAGGLTVWLGALGVVLYNAQMFLYATPFNHLFLLYVAMLGLSLWSIGSLLVGGTANRLAERAGDRMPLRVLTGYVWAVAALNALMWLRTIVPAIAGDRPASVLDGTGIATNPVFVQDLAIWLPLAVVAGVWLLRPAAWGYLVVGGLLAMWILESATIAVDQWFGSQADPASPVAAASMVLPLGTLVVVGLVPLVLFLRNLSR
jgi:hypothetical protein